MVTNTSIIAVKRVPPEHVRVTFGDGEFTVIKDVSPASIDILLAQAVRRVAALRRLKQDMAPLPPGVEKRDVVPPSPWIEL